MVGERLVDEEYFAAPSGDRLADQTSAAPLLYISAVSITVIPRSIPSRIEATSSARRPGLSAKCQVPWPMAAIFSPD